RSRRDVFDLIGIRIDGFICDPHSHHIQDVGEHGNNCNQEDEDHRRMGDLVTHPFHCVQELLHPRLLRRNRLYFFYLSSLSHDESARLNGRAGCGCPGPPHHRRSEVTVNDLQAQAADVSSTSRKAFSSSLLSDDWKTLPLPANGFRPSSTLSAVA